MGSAGCEGRAAAAEVRTCIFLPAEGHVGTALHAKTQHTGPPTRTTAPTSHHRWEPPQQRDGKLLCELKRSGEKVKLYVPCGSGCQGTGDSPPRTLGHQLELSPVLRAVSRTPRCHRARPPSSHAELAVWPSLHSSSSDARPPLRLPNLTFPPRSRHQGVGSTYQGLTCVEPSQHHG